MLLQSDLLRSSRASVGLGIAGSFLTVNRSALGAIAERSLSFQVTSEKFLEKFHFLIA
jgi:hypothetical protein